MSGRLFYTGAFFFASGIFIRSFFDVTVWFAAMLLLVGGACVVVAIIKRRGVLTPIVLCAVAAILCAVGVARTDLSSLLAEEHQLDRYVGEEEVTLSGYVSREVDVRERTAHVTVDVSSVGDGEVGGRVLVFADRFVDVSYGDRVEVTGELTLPETFETELGRSFDYPGYLAVRGIHHTMSFADIEKVVGERGGNILMHTLFSIKHTFMEHIEATIPEPSAGLGEGLLLGVKRALGEDLEAAFRATGIIHIVVLSGYNITIVAEAVMRLLSAFFAPRTRFTIGIGVIALFALLVGLSATVVRASIMASLVLVARATGKTHTVVRALVFSALVMLLINPLLLVHDPGFQLSFLATFGLILLAPLIEARLSLVPTKFQVREFVTATVATQIFVLPVLLYSIGELSLVAVPVNVLVLVAVPFAMLLTFLAGGIGIISTALALPFAYAAHLLLAYIIVVVEWFAALPYASVMVPSFPFWVVVISYVFLALLIIVCAQPRQSRVIP